mmetsp:Transcript_97619/g.281715  ORF Transcript_97619/g.281715 Transcript_97619/m.281715 type:complete len:225 (+) Transcript_97619:235-909(+)
MPASPTAGQKETSKLSARRPPGIASANATRPALVTPLQLVRSKVTSCKDAACCGADSALAIASTPASVTGQPSNFKAKRLRPSGRSRAMADIATSSMVAASSKFSRKDVAAACSPSARAASCRRARASFVGWSSRRVGQGSGVLRAAAMWTKPGCCCEAVEARSTSKAARATGSFNASQAACTLRKRSADAFRPAASGWHSRTNWRYAARTCAWVAALSTPNTR